MIENTIFMFTIARRTQITLLKNQIFKSKLQQTYSFIVLNLPFLKIIFVSLNLDNLIVVFLSQLTAGSCLAVQRLIRIILLNYNKLIMEEVLRQLYTLHHVNLQRKRIQKALDSQQYLLSARKKYDFREDISLRTPQTNYSIDDEIRFEKDMHEIVRNRYEHASSIQQKFQHFKLPMIGKKEGQKSTKNKLRTVVWAFIFINRINRGIKDKMLRKKRKTQKCCKNLINYIDHIVKGYYEPLLKEQLANYIQILEKAIEVPSLDQQKDIIQMLYYLAEKLSSSTITKDMLQFLTLTSTNKGFPPSNYLSTMEMKRLDFSTKYGCLYEVSQQQTRMIIGLGLGIKIFSFYILYQPWKLGVATKQIEDNYERLQEIIKNIGSVFYYILLEEFCWKAKQVRTINKNLIANLGVKPIKLLNPFNEVKYINITTISTENKHLIVGQTRQYLNQIQIKYPDLIDGIKQNIYKWISRISYACLKEAKKNINNSFEGTVASRTIINPMVRFDKVSKSVELQNKAGSLNKQKIKNDKKHNMKYTIE